MIYNVWLPGNEFYDYNDGVVFTQSYKNVNSGPMLCQSFTVPNAQAGFGITHDQVNPPFAITKPPKVCYSSTAEFIFVIKDSAGWLWSAPCPAQTIPAERGWSWDQFSLHSVQENNTAPPTMPAVGDVLSFQFSGGAGVHGDSNDVPQTIDLFYISGRSPSIASTGDIRSVKLTNKNGAAHLWKVGRIELVDGTRKPIKYLGALPFGIQQNGPRNRLSSQPYKGPLVAGYQSGVPWVILGDNEKLRNLLLFVEDSQTEFTTRNAAETGSAGIVGPCMHIYLPALWDCEQNGPIDSWVWDGPDGNPAWDGWQYRIIDAMGRTWAECYNKPKISSENKILVSQICTAFLDWLHSWLLDNTDKSGVPNNWNPTGWSQGTPLPSNRGLVPKFTSTSNHDCCLALKGAIFSGIAGYDLVKTKYIVHRCLSALLSGQVKNYLTEPEMNGAFTWRPENYEVYGFEHGEILEALALAKQHPEFLVK